MLGTDVIGVDSDQLKVVFEAVEESILMTSLAESVRPPSPVPPLLP